MTPGAARGASLSTFSSDSSPVSPENPAPFAAAANTELLNAGPANAGQPAAGPSWRRLIAPYARPHSGRGILDLTLIKGKELGVGGWMTGKGEGKTARSRSEDGLRRGRERLR